MEKVSDDSNKNILVHNEAESAQTEEPLPPDPELLRSGILLGLRAKPFSGNGRTVYRTLWIASHNRTLHPVLETPNLFIPRKDGFWRMEVKKKKVNDFIQDALVAYPMDQDFRQNSGPENQQIEEGHVQNTILFVGDDYVAIESTNSFHDNTQFISRYKMLPIDNAQSNMGVKLSEIEGEKAKEIFDKSAEAFLLSQTKEIENIETVIDESNFTMARRNGHWILRGRLNYDDATGRNNYVDFNIGMVPSQKLVNYDEMCISWNVIKARVPQALDAYTSPNGDMLIIITKNLISIYTLREHKISDKPIKNISIQEGESVVMAEWATGEYMERWEKGFNQLNPYILGD